MIRINIGYHCGDSTHCDKSKKCKYKGKYKFHNMSVEVHRFFKYHLHIDLPHLIYIGQKYKRLSGTDKCPYKKSRNYTCWDCKHQIGLRGCDIPNKDRKENNPIDGWSMYSKCGNFEKTEWADDDFMK